MGNQIKEFHEREALKAKRIVGYEDKTKITYRFNNHFHPYVGYLIQKLNKGDLKNLLATETQSFSEEFFSSAYSLNPGTDKTIGIHDPHPKKEVEFDAEGSYSLYNWELFFHIPIAIAVQLSKNQRFAEAQRWFHFIFDPTTNEPEDPNNPTQRYWKFKHFRDNTEAKLITELMETLGKPDAEDDEETKKVKERIRLSISEWQRNPFSPHDIAKFRPLAYQFNVVMKYLDNLIAWGDSLFRQFTIESINEATQLYVLAVSILGNKPQEVPRLTKWPARTYKQIKNKLDEFSNVLVEMENEYPLNSNIPLVDGASDLSRSNTLFGTTRQLYFCIPPNKKLMEYWETVKDRLFNIRHCMDIEGNVRPLPLFQPSLDPRMLVKAAAAGLDMAGVVGGLNQPVSNVRFSIVLQKALELCNEVRAMGNALLSAIEKGETEKLALIRQEHEIKILELTQDVRYLQWKEAEASTKALLKTRESAYQRYRHYQLLLGKQEGDFSDLEEISIERKELTEENFDDVYDEIVNIYGEEIGIEEYREEKMGLLGEAASAVSGITGFVDSALGVGSAEHLELNKTEDIDLNVFMPLSSSMSIFSGNVGVISSILSLIPQFDASGRPMGVGGGVGFGGVQLSEAAKKSADYIKLAADIIHYQGLRASKLATYQRRVEDWILQNNLAAKELQYMGRQIIGSLIREQITKQEYENHQTQIEQSRAVEKFLKDQKFSNEELYLWMQGEISKVYYDCYKFAFDVAKKAEVTMKHELMREEINNQNFIKFNYWDAGRKGLLSGESLYLDLKRMELAYLESNKREFEITKHISLQQLDPYTLLLLKATGSCEIEIPEWLFDLDCPGHYMRRIKTVGVSVPGIVGPYTSINCTLSLQKSSVRISPLLPNDSYERDNAEEDGRFRDYYGTIQSIVTSSGQNDSGMFEVNPRDERYLPFEGAGVLSTWKIELPTKHPQFNYNTISDVIVHMQYTARQGGHELRKKAEDSVDDIIKNNAVDSRLTRMFNLKHDFSNEWHKFKSDSSNNLKLIVKKEHFSYLSQGKTIKIVTGGSKLYSISDQKLNPIQNGFVGLTGAFSHNGDNTKKEIVLDKDKIKDKENVFVLLAYTIEQP